MEIRRSTTVTLVPQPLHKITPEMAVRLRRRGWDLPADRSRYEENPTGESLYQVAIEMQTILRRLNELDRVIQSLGDN